nr:40S ribosomal protein S15-like [Saimiri boliviensis boliviensis]
MTDHRSFLRIWQDGRGRAAETRTFRKFTYRGVDQDRLLNTSYEALMQLHSARQQRRLNRGLRWKRPSLLKRLRKAEKETPPIQKPEVVKTHLRDTVILPEMVGSVVGVYNSKTFNQVEIKPEMIGHYLSEFSITYKPVKDGQLGIGPLTPPAEVVALLIKAHRSPKKKKKKRQIINIHEREHKEDSVAVK